MASEPATSIFIGAGPGSANPRQLKGATLEQRALDSADAGLRHIAVLQAAVKSAAESFSPNPEIEAARQRALAGREAARQQREAQRDADRLRREQEREEAKLAREAAKPSMADKMMPSAGRSVASSKGRQLPNSLLRGIFGGLLRGR